MESQTRGESVKEASSVLVVAALILAGCTATVASPSSEEDTGSTGNATDGPGSTTGTATQASSNRTDAQPSLNLTVEVAGANATWRVAPMERLDPPWNVTVVEVFVSVNGTVTADGDPVAGEDVEGEAAVTIVPPWGCITGCPAGGVPETRRAPYEAATGADGNFSASAGPIYWGTPSVPPVQHPYCEVPKIEASGTLADGDETGSSDDDEVWMRVCTQSYT